MTSELRISEDISYSISDLEDQLVGDPNVPFHLPSPSIDESTLQLAEEQTTEHFYPSHSPLLQPGHQFHEQHNFMEVANADPERKYLVTTESLAEDQFFPNDAPLGPPARQVFPGQFNFNVEVSSADTSKKKYLYSHHLNRVYVDMNCDFAIRFTWHSVPWERAYVRACVVFSDREQAEKRVERCMQHRHENAHLPDNIRMNVLRSSREVGAQGVYYHGRVDSADSWYSVVVEFANTAQTQHMHAYKFVCKNSCSSGINRRPIAIIFTFEDASGNVYGRQMVGVRVCSCLRRDLHKDETTEGVVRKRPAEKKQPPKTKKVKIEVVQDPGVDDGVYTLPPLQIVGMRPLVAGLETMVRMTEQALELRRDPALPAPHPPHPARAALTASLEALKAALETYRNTSNLSPP